MKKVFFLLLFVISSSYVLSQTKYRVQITDFKFELYRGKNRPFCGDDIRFYLKVYFYDGSHEQVLYRNRPENMSIPIVLNKLYDKKILKFGFYSYTRRKNLIGPGCGKSTTIEEKNKNISYNVNDVSQGNYQDSSSNKIRQSVYFNYKVELVKNQYKYKIETLLEADKGQYSDIRSLEMTQELSVVTEGDEKIDLVSGTITYNNGFMSKSYDKIVKFFTPIKYIYGRLELKFFKRSGPCPGAADYDNDRDRYNEPRYRGHRLFDTERTIINSGVNCQSFSNNLFPSCATANVKRFRIHKIQTLSSINSIIRNSNEFNLQSCGSPIKINVVDSNCNSIPISCSVYYSDNPNSLGSILGSYNYAPRTSFDVKYDDLKNIKPFETAYIRVKYTNGGCNNPTSCDDFSEVFKVIKRPCSPQYTNVKSVKTNCEYSNGTVTIMFNRQLAVGEKMILGLFRADLASTDPYGIIEEQVFIDSSDLKMERVKSSRRPPYSYINRYTYTFQDVAAGKYFFAYQSVIPSFKVPTSLNEKKEFWRVVNLSLKKTNEFSVTPAQGFTYSVTSNGILCPGGKAPVRILVDKGEQGRKYFYSIQGSSNYTPFKSTKETTIDLGTEQISILVKDNKGCFYRKYKKN